MLENITGVIMFLGGVGAVVQNYPRWKLYNNKEDLYWVLGGILAILTAIYLLATQLFVIATSDNLMFIVWSRRTLIFVGFVTWMVLGFRTYILGK